MSAPRKRRSTDEWLHRKKRLSSYIVGIVAAISLAGAIGLAAFSVIHGTESRRSLLRLVCDQNAILRDFIAEPPDLARDEDALRRLNAERCDRLLHEEGVEE